jgi:3D (Asp-Asp-Asp) domain-containing protein
MFIRPKEDWIALGIVTVIVYLIASLVSCTPARAEGIDNLGVFKVTAYCSCAICCIHETGITASGHKVRQGAIACNWLPFHTKLIIQGFKAPYEVLDRGAKSLFGSKSNHIKHIDLWMASHREAQKWGVQYLKVGVIAS